MKKFFLITLIFSLLLILMPLLGVLAETITQGSFPSSYTVTENKRSIIFTGGESGGLTIESTDKTDVSGEFDYNIIVERFGDLASVLHIVSPKVLAASWNPSLFRFSVDTHLSFPEQFVRFRIKTWGEYEETIVNPDFNSSGNCDGNSEIGDCRFKISVLRAGPYKAQTIKWNFGDTNSIVFDQNTFFDSKTLQFKGFLRDFSPEIENGFTPTEIKIDGDVVSLFFTTPESIRTESLVIGDFFIDTNFLDGTFFQTDVNTNGNLILDINAGDNFFGDGDYNSEVFDAGSEATWEDFNFTENQPYRQQLPDNGVITPDVNMVFNEILLHFDFNGTDTSGNDRNGIEAGNPDCTVGGRFIRACDFDGVGDHFTFPDPDYLEDKNGMAISTWVKTAVPTIASGEMNIAFSKGAGDDLFEFFWNFKDDVVFILYDTSNVKQIATCTDCIQDTEWHYVVANYDGAIVSVWVDGIRSDITAAYTGSTQTQDNDLFVGGNLAGDDWNGLIDDTAIFSRGLTDDEIRNIYRRGIVDLNFQVRSCNDSACDGESFVGPDGTANTHFTDGNTNYDLNAVSDNQFFQYKAILNTEDFNSLMDLTPSVSQVDINFTPTAAPVNNVPVLDINAIDGNPDTMALPVFHYDVDANLTIDFNVFDADNNRLTIDLNFSTSQTQGTGTPFATDLNLDLQLCADLNFAQPAGVNCSWDLNIFRTLVPDDNYFILGVLSDSLDNDFNVTENSFAVDNNTMIDDLNAVAQTNPPLNSGDGNVLLQWTDLPNEQNYRVYRSDNSTDFNTVTTLAQNIVAFVDNTIADNTEFQYIVQAVFASGGDTNSNVASATTFDRTAPVSGTLTVTENPPLNYIDLNWTAATDNNTSSALIDYNVFRSPDNIDFNILVSLFDGTITHADTTAQDTNSPNTPDAPTINTISETVLDVNWTLTTDRGDRFFYFIQALDEQRNDSNSNTDTDVISTGVAQFFIDCQSGGTCTVGDGGDFDDVNTNAPFGATISGLDSSTEYCFRIKAIDNVDNNSALSGLSCGTTLGPGNAAPVLDVNGVDGNPDTMVFPVFSFAVDGVLAIDMNVFDADNNRLLLDLNFSTSQNQGTGTVIVDDLNLTLTQCVDLNFSSGVGVNCTIDFNISPLLVPDDNYFIIGVLDDSSGGTDFNSLDRSFKVDNVPEPVLADLYFLPSGQTIIDSNLLVSNFLKLNQLKPASATTVCRDGDNFLSTCSSSIVFKRNVRYLIQEDYQRILEEIKVTPLATFNMNSDPLGSKKHLGVIAESSPKGIQYIDEHGNMNVDIGSIRGYSWAAIKALITRVEALEKQVQELKSNDFQ